LKQQRYIEDAAFLIQDHRKSTHLKYEEASKRIQVFLNKQDEEAKLGRITPRQVDEDEPVDDFTTGTLSTQDDDGYIAHDDKDVEFH